MAKKKPTDNFYRAFEERHRGSRELIKSRLAVYLPFIEPLKVVYPGARAVDLGCGRGEWLELVNEHGFDGFGVDLDEGMLGACHKLGLKVEKTEAIGYLSSLDDASVAIVSGFHIAEHIEFSDLQILVQEALRVLLPGGLLILETPNPENLVVGTASFYLDPTHQKPIPPLLLEFLPEYVGFKRSKILRLQESQDLINNSDVSLFAVLNGVSPDYAVVAQKNGSEELLDALTTEFSAEYGLTLEKLANTYQSRVDIKTQQTEAKAQQAEAKAQQAEAKAQQAEAKAQQAEAKAQQAEAVSNEAWSQLQAIYTSKSWRITAPLRWVAHQLRLLRERGLKSRIKAFVKKIARIAIRSISARPRLKRMAIYMARKLGIEQRLRRIYAGADSNAQSVVANDLVINSPPGLEHLTPRARLIYSDLKAAMDRHKKERA